MATIDTTTFKALNGEAPLYPGKANYWVIVAKRPDLLKGSESERLEAAKEAAAGLLRRSGVYARNLRALDVWPAAGVPTGTRYALVQPQPMAYPEGSVYVSITWDAPEGSAKEVAWPWEHSLTGGWQDVYLGLVSVHRPSSTVDVPGPLDNAAHAAGATVDQMRDEIPELATTAMIWVAVGAVSLFALGRAFK